MPLAKTRSVLSVSGVTILSQVLLLGYKIRVHLAPYVRTVVNIQDVVV